MGPRERSPELSCSPCPLSGSELGRPSLSTSVWVGVPGPPSPPLLSVCRAEDPALASCSSQTVFLGWWPVSANIFWSLWRDSCNLERFLRRVCPGSCSSVRSKGA